MMRPGTCLVGRTAGSFDSSESITVEIATPTSNYPHDFRGRGAHRTLRSSKGERSFPVHLFFYATGRPSALFDLDLDTESDTGTDSVAGDDGKPFKFFAPCCTRPSSHSHLRSFRLCSSGSKVLGLLISLVGRRQLHALKTPCYYNDLYTLVTETVYGACTYSGDELVVAGGITGDMRGENL